MNKSKLLLNEEIYRIHELNGGNMVSGKQLIVVDIQPEYESGFKGFLYDFINFLNENYEQFGGLTFLYNGADTLGMISESDYRWWWIENGLEEHIVEDAIFYDKGYAFFRYCMDSDIDDEDTTNLIRYMIDQNVNDTRDLDKEFWEGFVEQYGAEHVRELLEFSGDAINIPDLMDFLQRYNNPVLCGGGINECLREVEIAFAALGKTYNVLSKYTY